MKYMLLIYIDESEPGPAVLMPEYSQFTNGLQKSGKFVYANRLQGPPRARTVRVRDGKPLAMDGPFAETKEWLCGFYIVDCRDQDEALELAAKIPSARYGCIEVRPIADE